MNNQKGIEKKTKKSPIKAAGKASRYPYFCPQYTISKIFIPVIEFLDLEKKVIQKLPTMILKEINNLGLYFKKFIHLSTHYTYTNSIYLYII